MANLSNINGKFVVEQTTGNIGIGTTDPDYLLHVNSSDVTNGTRLIIENTNGSGKKYGLIADNTGVFGVRDVTAGADRFSISNLGNATFTGNVNIGTALITPNTNFDNLVISQNGNSGITILSNSANDGGIYFGDENSNNRGQIKYLHASNSMTFTTDDEQKLTIDSSGNVGINDTSPNTANLSIKGQSTGVSANYPMLKLLGQNTSSDGLHITTTGTGNNYYAIKVATGANSSAFNVTNAGNVGIGTTSPGALLHIKGTGDAIRVESTNTGAGGAQVDLLHYSTSPA